MDQYIGRLLDDRYEILDVLGTGGMAVVYKARCHRLNRLVAIKILKDEFAGDEEFRRRFHAEGEAVAMLSHPNIVQVYDVSTSDNANYIVMELIDGISLKQYMEKKGVLNWKETLHFSMQIAKGLEHAHGRGIVHRDIKPHNVMVLKNGSVKVMDFGIARVMNKSNTLTKEALGSVHYISPEQAKGGFTDNRSDIYSLGVVMYEMMTGRPPYDGESAVAVAIQHINGGAKKPSVLNPNIPAGMEQIIRKAMALELRDRYVSATEMLQDMEEFRKNPTILFQHHFLTDDATQVIPGGSTPVVQKPTTAEKKVQEKTGPHLHKMRREPGARGTERPPQPEEEPDEILRRPRRQRPEPTPLPPDTALEKKKKEERNRVAATAIVICSAVVVIAIVLFLVALFNGSLLNREQEYVEVPYLEGKTFDEGFAARHPGFNIRLTSQEYHDTYREGQIIYQQPAGGTRVQRGTDLWLTVSMGPEPEAREMDDYVGAEEEDTYNILKNKGYEPLIKREFVFVYDAGIVFRTEPAAGEEVRDGQTVYVYVSKGPPTKEASMPNVVGLQLDRVKELLTQMEFTNVRYEATESRKPVNEVVYQSVAKDTLIDVATEIIIQYSAGLQEETAPATESETESVETEEPKTVVISFEVPSRPVEYRLEICLEGKREVLESKLVAPNTTSTYVSLSGTGTVAYDLYVDGVYERTQTISFEGW